MTHPSFLTQFVDINPINNEVVNFNLNDTLIHEGYKKISGYEHKKPLIQNFFHPAISQYYLAYAAFLQGVDNAQCTPELMEINEDIYMVQASSRYLYENSAVQSTLLRIHINCILIGDETLTELDKSDIFNRRANLLQLKAAYEQIQILVESKMNHRHEDILYSKHL